MLDLVIDSRPRDLGGGLTVGRILPYAKRRMVGPFAFLDHMGPAAFAPGEGIDVRPHPHIGLSTVTYLFEGEILHRDSLGSLQAIRPGAVNWMTAGRGIVHSERTDPVRRAAGGPLHGVQAWVALPEADEEADPAFAHHPEAGLPTLAAEGIWLRLIAGAAFGLASAVVTHSPLFYAHAELAAGARLALPEEHEERAAFVVAGAVEHAGTTVAAGQLLVLKPGGAPELTAAAPSRLMLLGGAPLGPRRIWWNFVSSRPERIEQAKADWRARRMTMPPGDSVEFVPLPE
ncbi:MAG: pirin family protein [Alphaproteobacteria bacterium]|nr:pirin family protein [Alphaproteobacteria bacterium]